MIFLPKECSYERVKLEFEVDGAARPSAAVLHLGADGRLLGAEVCDLNISACVWKRILNHYMGNDGAKIEHK